MMADIEDENPSTENARNFYFPVVQAEITECSTYAVVFRLKSSPPYTITANGGLFVLPDHRSVCVTIPKKAVDSKTKIPLQIKVGLLVKRELLGGVYAYKLLLNVIQNGKRNNYNQM